MQVRGRAFPAFFFYPPLRSGLTAVVKPRGMAVMEAGVVFCVVAVFAWGLAVIPIKKANRSPLAGLAVGLISGWALMLLVAALRNELDFSGMEAKGWGLTAAGGILRFPVATYCYYQAILRAGILLATPLARLRPVFVCLIVTAAGLEVPGGGVIAGTALAFAGTLFLFPRRTDVAVAGRPLPRDVRRSGLLLAGAASLAWALGDICLNQVSSDAAAVPASVRSVLALGFGTVAWLGLLLVLGKLPMVGKLGWSGCGWYALHGVMSFGIATYSMLRAFETLPVTEVSLLTSVWPLVSMAVGFLLFRERVSGRQALGLAFLVAGAAAVLI